MLERYRQQVSDQLLPADFSLGRSVGNVKPRAHREAIAGGTRRWGRAGASVDGTQKSVSD